jgi:hypothetical protein
MSHVATNDNPGDHDWHDFNFYIAPDPPYDQLISDGSYLNNNGFLEYKTTTKQLEKLSTKDERLLEVEWDMKYFSEKFWPTAGDRVWVFGHYIWDCGHPESYHNEIHPPSAVAFTRQEQDPSGPGGPNALANKTFVYIHGRSGLGISLPTQVGQPLNFDSYFDTPVAMRDYDFDIDLPPNTNPGRKGYARVVELPYKGPEPLLTVSDSTNKVHVHYPLNLGDPSPNRRFGAVIVSGWQAPAPSVTYRNIVVKVKQVIIRNQHTPLCQADWRLWVNVNGDWRRLKNTFGVFDGLPIDINEEFSVALPDNDESRLTLQISGWVSINDQVFGSHRSIEEVGIKLPSLGRAVEKWDFEDSGLIGSLFKYLNRHDHRFGLCSGFGNSPGELSGHFQDIGNEMSEPNKPAEFKRKSDDTVNDFGLTYEIVEPANPCP